MVPMHFTVIKEDSSIPLAQQKKFVEAFNLKELSDTKISQYYLSRKALEEVALMSGHQLLPHEIVLNEYHFLDKCPGLFFSLSHTKQYAAAIVVSSETHLVAGIDIEQKTRDFKAHGHRFFFHSMDTTHLSKLDLWCVKEAIFKSCSHMIASSLLLKDIIVSDNNTFLVSKDAMRISGEWKIIPHAELIIAIAFIAT